MMERKITDGKQIVTDGKLFLTEYCQKNGWDVDDDSLVEALQNGKVVHTGETDSHRWYDRIETVVEIDGTYIQFWNVHTTGDGDVGYGLEDELALVTIVKPKTREVIETYYVPVAGPAE